MSYDTVTTAVCKTLQSLGISPRKEHQIENALACQIESSGPEFVLSRLSNLVDWRKMHMKGEVSYHPDWHRYKNHRGRCIPADPIGSQLWSLSDRAFFTVTGALRKAVSLSVPSEKQLTKWLDGVRCENCSDPEVSVRSLNSRSLDQMERVLVDTWAGRPWFCPSDVTGSNIPGSGKFTSVKCEKISVKGRVVKTPYIDPSSLIPAYNFSINTAPLFVWKFLEDIDAPARMGEGIDNERDNVVEELRNLIKSRQGDYVLQDEGLMGCSPCFDDEYAASCEFVTHYLGFAHSVGNIGFLEQEGGKLRTVANPNRLVQWCNIPLGQVLSVLQMRRTGCYVYNQEDGMKWAQEKLRQGICLSSFDMSSATDRLDYSKWLDEKFSLIEQYPDRWPTLSRSLDLFRDTAKSPWTIPGHVADLIGSRVNEISWSVGQPLGLRPSFPILTNMNADFAEKAIVEVDGVYSDGHYACVGDDLIIETKYAEAYMRIVRAYNGLINNEKTMESDRYAEFCSHMITKSTIYPLKPRWVMELDGSTQNVEKFSTSGLKPQLPQWVFNLHDELARYSISGLRTLPYSVTRAPLSLDTRAAVNTLIAACHPGNRDRDFVTLQTLFERYASVTPVLGQVTVKHMSSSYAEGAYPRFGGTESKPLVWTKLDATTDLAPEMLGVISTDSSTSVEVPVKQDWDYREDAYVVDTSKLSSDKRLAKKLRSITTKVEGDLVEASLRDNGVTTTVLVDLLPENPQAIVAHRYHSESQGSKTVETVQDILMNSLVESALYDRRRSQANEPVKQVLEQELEDDNLDYC